MAGEVRPGRVLGGQGEQGTWAAILRLEAIFREYHVMPNHRKPSEAVRWQIGAKVRVKPGVSDPDFPDMPLGGWSENITQIIEHEGQINCVFELDERTLTSIHGESIMANEKAKKEVNRSEFIEFEDALFDAIDDSGNRVIRAIFL